IARIYLVRHGETQANRDEIIQGHLDAALNDKGFEQARLVGEALKRIKFHNVAFSSDLSRAVSTAEEILIHHPEVKMVKQEELRERYMGELEGKRARKGTALVASVDQKIETAVAFSQRAVTWWNNNILGSTIDGENLTEPRNILVTTHGGFIVTLVRGLIGSKKARCGEGVVIWKCLNTSVSVLEVMEDETAVVVQYGDVAHL
ncbi:phosphoglycerate mutase-like protein, partial [Phlegmacium glaucopus]